MSGDAQEKPPCECPLDAHVYDARFHAVYCTNCASHCFAHNKHGKEYAP